mmetsp:Transcript_31588/g.76293  ORF Transcript_31588/g.76293 Transcript_31588/m.76293 type:complete len:229 (+) Transcript_31588:2765-3451(+)
MRFSKRRFHQRLCTHRGAQILLMYIIQKCDDWDFETLVKKMPEPIHKIVSCAIAVPYCFPSKDTEEAQLERRIQQKSLDKLLSQFGLADDCDDEEEDEWDDGVALANPGSEFPVANVSGGATVEVIKLTNLFLDEMEEREETTGHAQKHNNATKIEEFAKQLATPGMSKRERKRQLLRLQRLYDRAEKDVKARSMLSLYARIIQEYIEEELLKLSHVDGSMIHPTVKW